MSGAAVAEPKGKERRCGDLSHSYRSCWGGEWCWGLSVHRRLWITNGRWFTWRLSRGSEQPHRHRTMEAVSLTFEVTVPPHLIYMFALSTPLARLAMCFQLLCAILLPCKQKSGKHQLFILCTVKSRYCLQSQATFHCLLLTELSYSLIFNYNKQHYHLFWVWTLSVEKVRLIGAL